MKNIIVVLTLFFGITQGFCRLDYTIDFGKPSSVVKAANRMLVNSDYESMLKITALNEKKRTEQTLSNLRSNPKLYRKVKNEMARIKDFKILGEEIYDHSSGKIALVRTEWSIRIKENEIATKPRVTLKRDKKRKQTTHVYTDYLLKLFDGRWKIISQKSR